MRFRAPFLLSMALVTLAASAIAQTGSSGLSHQEPAWDPVVSGFSR
jgi:hypothetical protein